MRPPAAPAGEGRDCNNMSEKTGLSPAKTDKIFPAFVLPWLDRAEQL